MAKILDMPKLSPTMEEGVLATWHKKEGDSVEVDDLLAEVETDKATMEFRAFDKGTLLKVLVDAGAQVKLGQPVAILGNPGEDISALAAEAGAGGDSGAKPAPAKAEKDDKGSRAKAVADADVEEGEEHATETPRSPRVVADKAAQKAPQTMRPAPTVDKGNVLTRTERDASGVAAQRGGANGERVLASPYVRKVARERGIDLSSAQGTGQHGRIVPAVLVSRGRALPGA